MSIPKVYSAINYDFRPISYWSPATNPLEVALRNVKGRNRREIIQDYYSRGLLTALSENLLSDTLDEDTRRSVCQIHPWFMGGEYLPDCCRHEVEIGRTELESTTRDVTSVRARSRGERIEWTILRRTQLLMLGRPSFSIRPHDPEDSTAQDDAKTNIMAFMTKEGAQ